MVKVCTCIVRARCTTTTGRTNHLLSFHVMAFFHWRRHYHHYQWRRQNFAPGGHGRVAQGSEVRDDKVIQKWKPSGVRTAKTNMAENFATACHSNWWLWRSNFELTELVRKISTAIVWSAAEFAYIRKLRHWSLSTCLFVQMLRDLSNWVITAASLSRHCRKHVTD